MSDLLDRFIDWLATSKGPIGLVILAMWGGTVRYVNQIRKDNKAFKFAELIVEWIVSGFSGLLAGYLCFAADASWATTCFVVGVAGHMGGRALFMFENKVKTMLGGKNE